MCTIEPVVLALTEGDSSSAQSSAGSQSQLVASSKIENVREFRL